MISLYPSCYYIVNKNDRQNSTSLIRLLVEVHSLITKIMSNNNMPLYSEINHTLLDFNFNNSVRYTYPTLVLENPLHEQFHVSLKHLANKLKIKLRQLRNYLSELEIAGFLKRSYRTIDSGGRKLGNCLFLELTPPIEEAS